MSAVPVTGLSQPPPRALIADDQQDVLTALRLLLKGEGYQTEEATSPTAVVEALEAGDFDLLLMDLNYARDTTSGHEGLDLISRIKKLDDTLPVVVMTAWGSVDLAVEAMRLGVRDFVQKPWDNSKLLSTLRVQVATGRKLRRQKREHEHETAEAREIQRELLPRRIPQIRGCEIAAAWQPARDVGGDYFDVLRIGETQAAICIADVEGKGLPAALVMANVQAATRAFASANPTPRRVCEKVNQLVAGNFSPNRFVTFFYGVIDTETGKLVYANAGHCAPLLVRRDGTVVHLTEGGAVLGVFREWTYEQREVELRNGDRLVLFTDGVTEARDGRGEELGEDRLIQLLATDAGAGAHEMLASVLGQVSKFAGETLDDDATLVVVAF